MDKRFVAFAWAIVIFAVALGARAGLIGQDLAASGIIWIAVISAINLGWGMGCVRRCFAAEIAT